MPTPLQNASVTFSGSSSRSSLSITGGGAGEPTPSAAWSLEQANAIERVLAELGVRFDEPAWGE